MSGPAPMTLDRLMGLVEYDTNGGCWLWSGYLNPDGYGSFGQRGTTVRVHRVTYEALIGAVPGGLQLDHLCRVRCCCNPAHLEPVTGVENVLRGSGPTALNARKTHCKHGHEFTPRNTYYKRGWRICRACQVTHTKSYKRRVRQTLLTKEQTWVKP